MNWYQIKIASVKTVDFNKSSFAGQLVATDGSLISPNDQIVVYHATTPEVAQILLTQGFDPTKKPQRQPTIITDDNVAKMLKKEVGDPLDYEPGRGMGKGLYVGVSPKRLTSVFGSAVVRLTIFVSDLTSPPERPRLSPIRALMVDDGYIEKVLPASAFSS